MVIPKITFSWGFSSINFVGFPSQSAGAEVLSWRQAYFWAGLGSTLLTDDMIQQGKKKKSVLTLSTRCCSGFTWFPEAFIKSDVSNKYKKYQADVGNTTLFACLVGFLNLMDSDILLNKEGCRGTLKNYRIPDFLPERTVVRVGVFIFICFCPKHSEASHTRVGGQYNISATLRHSFQVSVQFLWISDPSAGCFSLFMSLFPLLLAPVSWAAPGHPRWSHKRGGGKMFFSLQRLGLQNCGSSERGSIGQFFSVPAEWGGFRLYC